MNHEIILNLVHNRNNNELYMNESTLSRIHYFKLERIVLVQERNYGELKHVLMSPERVRILRLEQCFSTRNPVLEQR